MEKTIVMMDNNLERVQRVAAERDNSGCGQSGGERQKT